MDATHGPAAGPASRPRRAAALRATARALATFSGGGSWAEPLFADAPSADWVRVPTGSVSPVGALPKRDASRLGSLSYGSSLIQGFAFLIPAPSACARSLLVLGACDLTHRWTDASDSAAPGRWKGPTIPAP